MLDMVKTLPLAAFQRAMRDTVERLRDGAERFDDTVKMNTRFVCMFAAYAVEISEYDAGNGCTTTVAIVYDLGGGDAVNVNDAGEIVTNAPCRSFEVLNFDAFMLRLSNFAADMA